MRLSKQVVCRDWMGFVEYPYYWYLCFILNGMNICISLQNFQIFLKNYHFQSLASGYKSNSINWLFSGGI